MAYVDDKLGRGEKIVYTGHQHWIVIFRKAFQWLALFIVAVAVAIWVSTWTNNANPQDFWVATAKPILLLMCLVVGLISVAALGIAYLVWRSEEFVITNERVIYVEGIFNKHLSDSSLDKINDVKMDQSLFGRMLGYGTISVLTGNEGGANVYHMIGNPNEFKRIMLDVKNGFYGDAADAAREFREGRSAPAARLPQQPYPASSNGRASYADERGEQRYADPRQAASAYQPQSAYPASANYSQDPNPQDIPGMIEKLARLRDAGAITQAEFDAKKNDLLRRM